MKITKAQKVIFSEFVYRAIEVFALNERPRMWDENKSLRCCDGFNRVDKKTAKSLYRKNLCRYVNITMEDGYWYGIELTDKGKALARLVI